MSLHLVTGYAGESHITAPNVAAFNRMIFGSEVIPAALSGQATSNTNVRIYGTDIVWQGRHIVFDGDYQDVSIDAGSAGRWRWDVIALDYTRDMETGVESVQLVVVKGTPSTEQGGATRPDLIYGNIDSSFHVQEILFDVRIDEQIISQVELAPNTWLSFTDMLRELSVSGGNLSGFISAIAYPVGTVIISTLDYSSGLPQGEWTQIKSEVIQGVTYYWWRKTE